MGKSRISVLLVEDDPVAAGLFNAQIASDFTTSFDTAVVDTLEGAEEELARRRFDVVTLDLMLPHVRGLDALDRLRELAPDLPIVVLTGLDDEELAVQALQQGAQDYLVKGDLSGRLISRSLRYAIERQRLTETLGTLALLDEPTGLYNRRGLLTLAEQQLKTARRLRRGVGLIRLELSLDHGRPVEHEAADERDSLARRVAQILRDTFRGSDLIARIDHDVFLVLAIEPDRQGLETALDRLRERLGRADSGVGAVARLRWTALEEISSVTRLVAELEADGGVSRSGDGTPP